VLEQAVVLAGGRGTRLGALTERLPKPMMPVAGGPFLDQLLWNLQRHGLRRVVLSVGYLADTIRDHVGDGSHYGLEVSYCHEDEPAGTGGALALALPQLEERFLVLNGDTLFDLNYLDLALALAEHDGALALRSVPDAGRYGSVQLEAGRVVAFLEKGRSGPGQINGGVYALRRSVVERSLGSSIERDWLPRLASEGRLAGRSYDGFFLDIGLPESLARAQLDVPDWRRMPAALLDRDGVLNVDRGYVHTPDAFAWRPGAIEAVKWLNDRGVLTIVVTNQTGIGRGYYTEEAFHDFSAWIDGQLHRHGAHLDATYFCPDHPEHGLGDYRRDSGCRKPQPGMLEAALRDWGFDRDRSFLVGDKVSDVQAAERFGIPGRLIGDENLLEVVRALHTEPRAAFG
jgi:D-glycero-D-manno-heptose 1,7-bisphosphate phosphatase